jgi:hypothetical protein
MSDQCLDSVAATDTERANDKHTCTLLHKGILTLYDLVPSERDPAGTPTVYVLMLSNSLLC